MASWSRNKVDSSTINGGNEYERGDRVSRQNLNAMENAGLYAQDFAEHLADTPDTTNAGNVGTPSVSFVDNVVGGKTYKKFKFENLKGATGATGNGIASVSKTSTSGLTDTYTITFTNGNSTTFTVNNGDSVDMRVDSGYFQWKRTQDSTWTNLIAVSAIAQVDQSLDVSSTNAISNSAVTTEINKFSSSSSATFGNYVVEKREPIWANSTGKAVDGTTTTRTLNIPNTTLNNNDFIEIVYMIQGAGMNFGYRTFRIPNLSRGFSYIIDAQKYYGMGNNVEIYNADATIEFNSNTIVLTTGTASLYSSSKTLNDSLKLTTHNSYCIFTLFRVDRIVGSWNVIPSNTSL